MVQLYGYTHDSLMELHGHEPTARVESSSSVYKTIDHILDTDMASILYGDAHGRACFLLRQTVFHNGCRCMASLLCDCECAPKGSRES